MKFIEIVEGVSINKDSIVSVNTTDEENVILIKTESREYKVPANYPMFMGFLEKDEEKKEVEEDNSMITQFFGG